MALYDTIGLDYARLRRPDRRIAEQISNALGDAKTVLNVGAGAGSYEPIDKDVTALEPSAEMIAQRAEGTAKCVQGIAEDLPFADDSFDAVMAILTVHHWTDQAKGMQELRRVSKGPVVILTFDPEFRGFWLVDYVPGLTTLDDAQMPKMSAFQEWFANVEVQTVPLPHDCSDGFLYAYWRRPAAYLDPRVRAAMSSFHALGDVSNEMAQLEADLQTGAWGKKYGDLMDLDSWDGGYRLIIAQPA